MSGNSKIKTYEDILPSGTHEATTEFLQKVVEKMYDHLKFSFDRSKKVLEFEDPEALEKVFDLELPKDAKSLDEIVEDCERTMQHSVKTGNPRFLNQLFQGIDMISLAGEWVTAATNASMYTYEVAPVYNLIEKKVLDRMCKIVGWEEGDGLFNPGGSISNLYATQVARHFRFPNTKDDGMFNMPKLTIFTSKASHYSVKRSASILGFGLNQCKKIDTDDRGKMSVPDLERQIKKSIEDKEIPLVVFATAGTTVMGAFDPIHPIADLCKKYNIWLHVDAAWGGGALVSRTHRKLMDGIERADSVVWNPHKLLGAHQQCSTFLTKHKNQLKGCNEMCATYLFQQDKHYDMDWDTGDKTIQCGRHVDVFKFWLMWRAKGDIGLEKSIDHLFNLAQLLTSEVKRRDNFEMVLENPECTNVCFWFIPKSLRNMDRNTKEFRDALHNVAPKIKERMMLKGSMMIGYQPIDDKPNFFRMICANGATTSEDILFLLDEIEALGADL